MGSDPAVTQKQPVHAGTLQRNSAVPIALLRSHSSQAGVRGSELPAASLSHLMSCNGHCSRSKLPEARKVLMAKLKDPETISLIVSETETSLIVPVSFCC